MFLWSWCDKYHIYATNLWKYYNEFKKGCFSLAKRLMYEYIIYVYAHILAAQPEWKSEKVQYLKVRNLINTAHFEAGNCAIVTVALNMKAFQYSLQKIGVPSIFKGESFFKHPYHSFIRLTSSQKDDCLKYQISSP